MRHLGQPKSATLKVLRFWVVRDSSCIKKDLLPGRALIPPNVLLQALVGIGHAILYLSILPCITLLDTESYIGWEADDGIL
jgi:hypothetical protein